MQDVSSSCLHVACASEAPVAGRSRSKAQLCKAMQSRSGGSRINSVHLQERTLGSRRMNAGRQNWRAKQQS
jgi:hypothetical protein